MAQQYTIYSKTRPDGVTKRDLELSGEILAAIDKDGVYRGQCPCCTKAIVIRPAESSSTMGDEHFLMHAES
jgi:hypothetical protein